MRTIPYSAKPYQRTSEFSEDSVPKGLLRDHSTKVGVWGRICVLEGRLEYTIQTSPAEKVVLSPGFDGIVTPAQLHFVKPLGPVRFFVEFWREAVGADAANANTSDSAIRVREERPGDASEIARVQTAAFGQADEARLVDALRESDGLGLSLVAEIDAQIVGHVMVSAVRLAARKAVRTALRKAKVPDARIFAGLAPIGVLPEFQRRAVGAALMRDVIARAAGQGWSAIFLLGDPAYYARFGFTLAAPLGFHYASEAFDAGFQVLKLEPDALANLSGYVEYDPAFESALTS